VGEAGRVGTIKARRCRAAAVCCFCCDPKDVELFSVAGFQLWIADLQLQRRAEALLLSVFNDFVATDSKTDRSGKQHKK
jgi:hypothetical protein